MLYIFLNVNCILIEVRICTAVRVENGLARHDRSFAGSPSWDEPHRKNGSFVWITQPTWRVTEKPTGIFHHEVGSFMRASVTEIMH